MNKKKTIDRIAELIARFRAEVETLNSQNLYDINIHAENVIIPILNYVYGLSLKNANLEEKNYSAIDLIDYENRVAIQVTSTANSEKVKHTLEQYKKHKQRDEFDSLLIYIITKKQKTYSDEKFDEIINDEFEFDSSENILDFENLLTEVNSWISLPKILEVLELFEQEFNEQKIEYRQNVLENRDKLITETLYPNLLEIELPEKVYVGTIGVNRDEIITKSWETKYKLKKSAPEISVLNRAFEHYGIPYSRDWHVFEKKILSFKPLDNSSEPLSNLVEIGSVEELALDEFASSGYKYELALSRLIDNTIQELTSKKGIQWLRKERMFRFRPPKLIRSRKVSWKNKKKATRTVVAEVWNKDRTQITHFRQLSFKVQSFLSESTWFLAVTPTWSYTYDGYRTHKFESDLITDKKKLESNNAVYQHFMFISYCLSNKISEEEENYDLISFKEPLRLPLTYKSDYGN
ncbi:MAG: SMEK domain-containing protein [Muricauda sp.]|nr:SMEK domain-containing protein [Allomuricauda sp.]MBO6531938.1 SMEK domain-containing protein [Allomuricauda sp.]MBO6588596.1 SMEK domain-containing protein [Allomuricauda sp.]MBO6618265.1 SMEK domain-containing protein [Allomuricauda sp.]MBO6644134.1 SMEK domain-containing protein [Allomuricauda sp.]MBO6747018.1 SMEK domain-containing protein [Allomuricauda sp.]